MTYDATKLSTEFQMNTTTAFNQYDVELTALANGGFVAVWTSQGISLAGRSIVAQLYDANGLPDGGEIIVQSEDSEQFQKPVVTGLDDGSFTVFWTSQDAIEGRRYDASGIEMDTSVVQTRATDDGGIFYFSDVMGSGGFNNTFLNDMDIIGTSDGGYTIAGHRFISSGRSNDLKFYHYDADHPDGNWSGVGTLVKTDGSNIAANQGLRSESQDQVDMASLSNDTMVVVWRQDSFGTPSIYGRIVDSDSTTPNNSLGDAFQINSSTVGAPTDPVVTALNNGGFVVTWHTLNDSNLDLNDVKSQMYASNGTPIGVELTVNTITAASQGFSDVAALADGGYVVTWQSYQTFSNSWAIYARRFDAQGEPLDTSTFGGQFKVSSFSSLQQTDPSIVATDDGGFTIAWTTGFQDGSDDGIFAQRYLAELHGTGLADTLNDTGAGRLFGYEGADVIKGFSGADLIYGGKGNDLLFGGQGQDTLNGENGNDTLNGGNGGDDLFGGSGRDVLNGGKGGDVLNGDNGQDTLNGGNGADILNGGNGLDTLNGGNGVDTFVFSDGIDKVINFVATEDLLQADAADITTSNINGDTLVTDASSGFSLLLEDVTLGVGDLMFA